MLPILKFKRLPHNPDLPLPEYETEGAAGMDVRSSEEVILWPGETYAVETGLAVELPPGYELQCRPRSGLAAKHGITVLNAPGTIDEDYRGEIKVILHSTSISKFYINRGDRIAQLVLAPVVRAQVIEVDELSTTARGNNGFGSTGSS